MNVTEHPRLILRDLSQTFSEDHRYRLPVSLFRGLNILCVLLLALGMKKQQIQYPKSK